MLQKSYIKFMKKTAAIANTNETEADKKIIL